MGMLKTYMAGILMSFSGFILGTTLGWSGPTEKAILSGQTYKFVPNHFQWGWVCSFFALGAAFMCLPVGILLRIFGRKRTMLGLVIPGLLGWAMLIGGQHVAMLYIGRILLGAFGGGSCVTAPMYIAEIAEVKVRGFMGCFYQLMLSTGILFIFVISAFLKVQVVNIVCGILSIMFFLFIIGLPESPVYLVQKGKLEKAEKAMKWLRGSKADISGEMAAFVAEGKMESASFREAMSRKSTLLGLVVAIMLLLFQQLLGINAVIFYVTGIFEKAGTGISPHMCTIIIGVVQVISTALAIFIIDRAGRKVLLLLSGFLMALTTLVVGIFFQFLIGKNVGPLVVAAICIYFFGFSIGYGPICWVMMTEVFAQDVKPVAAAIVGSCAWLFAFIVTNSMLPLVHAVGMAAIFWIFSLFGILSCIFVFFVVPETKGKTLDEIQALLR